MSDDFPKLFYCPHCEMGSQECNHSHGVLTDPNSLDAAWQAAEALVAGSTSCESDPFLILEQIDHGEYEASIECRAGKRHHSAAGSTPVAALRTLIADLIEEVNKRPIAG